MSPRNKVDDKTRAKMADLYRGGLSSSAISERYGLSQGTVINALRKAGVTLIGQTRADYCGGGSIKSARRVAPYVR